MQQPDCGPSLNSKQPTVRETETCTRSILPRLDFQWTKLWGSLLPGAGCASPTAESIPEGMFDFDRSQLTALNSSKFEFRLFVSSSRAECRETVSNLQDFLEHHLNGQYELTVVDVVERPDLAKRDGILATPTLVKVAPGPELRMIGSISNR